MQGWVVEPRIKNGNRLLIATLVCFLYISVPFNFFFFKLCHVILPHVRYVSRKFYFLILNISRNNIQMLFLHLWHFPVHSTSTNHHIYTVSFMHKGESNSRISFVLDLVVDIYTIQRGFLHLFIRRSKINEILGVD